MAIPGAIGISFPENDTDILAREKSVSVHVNSLEAVLSALLAEYRRAAEDALEQHLENVMSRENSFQMEVATLRAENGLLRDRLGLEKGGPADLMQSAVVLHDEDLRRRKNKNDDDPLGDERKPFKKKDEAKGKKIAGMEKRGDIEVPQIVGGCWQQFVAWVPNGAALGNPEPWKPLADIDMTGMFSNQVEDVSEHSDAGTKEAYELLDMWQVTTTELQAKRLTVQTDKETKELEKLQQQQQQQQAKEPEPDDTGDVFSQEQRRFFIVHPQCRKRILWDVFSLLLVVYDMVTIPMGFFDLSENNPFLRTMDWTSRIFWTFDMAFSVCTAVVMPNGDVNFDFKFIVKRYFKTWFGLDIVILSSDWLEEVFTQMGTSSETMQLTQTFRIVRVVRLLRLVRMSEVMAQITERIQSDSLSFLLDNIKCLVFVMAVSHVNGCVWWGIGTAYKPKDAKDSWVYRTGYADDEVSAQYLISLHWSLSQFTGGMTEFVPETTIERFYAVVAWLFGFAWATFIVSYITSKLTQSYMIGGAQSRQMSTLKKYLNQNDISSNLALRMVKSAKHAMSGDLTPDAVEMLQVVSEPLKVEMHFEQYSTVLRCHHFFSDYILEGSYVMRRVCHFATSTLMLANGDMVFSKGENPVHPKMYFVWKGSLEYSMGPGDATAVGEKQWVAEPVLWTKWCHRGTLTATNDVKLVCLDARVFQDIVDRFKDTGGFDPRIYAADFVRHLNQIEVASDLTAIKG